MELASHTASLTPLLHTRRGPGALTRRHPRSCPIEAVFSHDIDDGAPGLRWRRAECRRRCGRRTGRTPQLHTHPQTARSKTAESRGKKRSPHDVPALLGATPPAQPPASQNHEARLPRDSSSAYPHTRIPTYAAYRRMPAARRQTLQQGVAIRTNNDGSVLKTSGESLRSCGSSALSGRASPVGRRRRRECPPWP